jgi:hypothetical protein
MLDHGFIAVQSVVLTFYLLIQHAKPVVEMDITIII